MFPHPDDRSQPPAIAQTGFADRLSPDSDVLQSGTITLHRQGAVLLAAGLPRRTKFRAVWLRACEKAGVADLHFHDIRGSGLALTARQGATTAGLMFRAGHKSYASAKRYEHASAERYRMTS